VADSFLDVFCTSPDGVGHQGVYLNRHLRGGGCESWEKADGTLYCNKHTCVGGKPTPAAKSGFKKYWTHCKGGITPYKGTCDQAPCKDKKYCPDGKYCDKINPQVCTKRTVLHVDEMSRSAGVLIVKRSSCFKGKCSVFKVTRMHMSLSP